MRAFALLAGLLLSGCGGATAANPAPPAPPPPRGVDAAAAIRRGTAYLLGAQNLDGSWGSFDQCHLDEIYLGTVAAHHSFSDATSALCTLALLGLPEGDPAVRKALERGIEHLIPLQADLRQSGSAIYDVWGNLFALQCLARASRDPRLEGRRESLAAAARRRIAALAWEQSALGGWGYYDFRYKARRPSGELAASFTTAAALVALDEARKAGLELPPAMLKTAVPFLTSLRVGNGAFLYAGGHRYAPNGTPNKIKGSLGRSQAGDCALSRYEVVGQPQLVKGLENFLEYHHFIEIGRQRQHPHEAWYATAPYYYFFGHYYAALNVAALPETERARFAPPLEAILVANQEPDGSWWDYPMYGYYKAYGTGLALLALEALRPASSGSSP